MTWVSVDSLTNPMSHLNNRKPISKHFTGYLGGLPSTMNSYFHLSPAYPSRTFTTNCCPWFYSGLVFVPSSGQSKAGTQHVRATA